MSTAAERQLDRARVYRLMARLFQAPEVEDVARLRTEDLPAFVDCLAELGATDDLLARAQALRDAIEGIPAETLCDQWNDNFEPSGSVGISPTETAHNLATGQEAWLKTYRIADVAGFYKAFGVEVEPGTERPDHLGAELEFMQLLALKEAVALSESNSDGVEVCQQAASAFLEDHLGTWVGILAGKLQGEGVGDVYPSALGVLTDFVQLDADAQVRSA